MSWKLGLTFYSNRIFVINPLVFELKELKKAMQKSNFHIYLLCKRKKLFFESCDQSEGEFNVTKFYYLNERHDKEHVTVKHSKEIVINDCKDGICNIDFKENKGVEIEDYTLVNSLFHMQEDFLGDKEKRNLPSDLEVLYVGQSFGRNKKRQIDKRLTNHEKLQKIALEIINKGTSEEVLVIGLDYLVKDLATAFVTVDADRENFSLENLLKLKANASVRIPESQEVTVYEAALINHFQPELNVEYKETFPSLGYSSYEEIFNTKFDYTSVEINTYETGSRIFSQECPERKYYHNKQFALDSKDQKKEFFDYLFTE